MGSSVSREERRIKEIAGKETLLQCPVLVDLGHGTVRHRQIIPDLLADRHEGNRSLRDFKTGYFYHPRLNDFSEDADCAIEDRCKLQCVVQPPKKGRGQRLYYIYGNKLSDEDTGMQLSDYKPHGKGYNWPEAYRKANNLYYDLLFPDEAHASSNGLLILTDEDASVSSGISSSLSGMQKDNLLVKVKSSAIIAELIEKISLHLLLPSAHIHLLFRKQEIDSDVVISSLRGPEKPKLAVLTVQLRLT